MNNHVWKTVGQAIGKACKGIGYGVMLFAPRIIEAYVETHKNSTDVEYYDAVSAIVGSGMWSSDKPEAIATLKRNGNSDYYKAVIAVANSSEVWESDKLGLIRDLGEQ